VYNGIGGYIFSTPILNGSEKADERSQLHSFENEWIREFPSQAVTRRGKISGLELETVYQ